MESLHFFFLCQISWPAAFIASRLSFSQALSEFAFSAFSAFGFPVWLAMIMDSVDLIRGTGETHTHFLIGMSVLWSLVGRTLFMLLARKVSYFLPPFFSAEHSRILLLVWPWIPILGWLITCFSKWGHLPTRMAMRDIFLSWIVGMAIYVSLFYVMPNSLSPQATWPVVWNVWLLLIGVIGCFWFYRKKLHA